MNPREISYALDVPGAGSCKVIVSGETPEEQIVAGFELTRLGDLICTERHIFRFNPRRIRYDYITTYTAPFAESD